MACSFTLANDRRKLTHDFFLDQLAGLKEKYIGCAVNFPGSLFGHGLSNWLTNFISWFFGEELGSFV
jgi:hypothetical protein